MAMLAQGLTEAPRNVQIFTIKRLSRLQFVVLDWFIAKIDDHRMETALEP